MLSRIVSVSLSAILAENFIFSRFLGICPFVGVAGCRDTAVGMGLAVTFVMSLASAVCWWVDRLLTALGLAYLQTLAFILVIASLVQFVEMFLRKNIPSLYRSLGIYLPLITTNCAVLGAVLLNAQEGSGFFESVFFGAAAGLGFLLAITLFAEVRERLDYSAECPKCFEGTPISLITAALIALAFMGFRGMKIL
ncbi:MAG: RnfABCDGE type electron transport complex subunit A [Clostridiales bacterium]|nr:RnfABCDGE type electron transport complex subunit A [Candidatus Apopatocola equi]